MPNLTQNEIATLAKGVRPGGKLPKNTKPVGKTSAEVDAFVTTPPPTPPPSPPRQPPVSRDGLVAFAKKFFPVESAEFTDKEIGDYAQHYMDDTVANTIRMVGLHMKDRLAKRAAGTPWPDDSTGLANA